MIKFLLISINGRFSLIRERIKEKQQVHKI